MTLFSKHCYLFSKCCVEQLTWFISNYYCTNLFKILYIYIRRAMCKCSERLLLSRSGFLLKKNLAQRTEKLYLFLNYFWQGTNCLTLTVVIGAGLKFFRFKAGLGFCVLLTLIRKKWMCGYHVLYIFAANNRYFTEFFTNIYSVNIKIKTWKNVLARAPKRSNGHLWNLGVIEQES